MAAPGTSWNGMFYCAEDPEAVIQGVVMGTAGPSEYEVRTVGPGTIVLARRYIPTWAVVVAVLSAFSLVGLLALLIRYTETLSITVSALPAGGSRVQTSGVATPLIANRLTTVFDGFTRIPAPSATSAGLGQVPPMPPSAPAG